MLSIFVVLFGCLPCIAQNDFDSEFYDGLEKLKVEYRVGKAASIKKADRVVVYLVDFDGMSEEDAFDSLFADQDKLISIAPYGSNTKILKKKEIEANDRKRLLDLLSAAIAKPQHSGGAMCHFPIHGVRVYAGDKLLHEGTFCWVCSNFSFSYPQGSDWLDTNADLKAIFTEIMPIPQSELDRFSKKYPVENPKGEQGGADQPATAPGSKPDNNDKPQPESEDRRR